METTTTPMEDKRDLEGQIQRRSELTDFVISEDERTIEFPFSSELPVSRGYLGNEILDHREESIDFSRLNSSAPLLLNHDTSKVIGVVERGWLDKDKKRGMASVRFARNALGKETLDMVKDKIYRNVSVGYSVSDTEEGDNSYRVTSWSPHEVSIVSVPADPTVGVGRSIANESVIATQEQPTISDEERASAPTPAAPVAPPQPQPQQEMTTTPDLDQVRSKAAEEAAKTERSRIATITALTSKHGFEDLGRQLVENGSTIDVAREAVLDKIGQQPVPTVSPVELNDKEQRDYRISAGIRSLLTGDWSSKDAGYVRELSQEVENKGHRRSTEKSFFVPYTALSERATYVTSTANVGGNIVATELLAGDFIEALRNQSVMLEAGVRTMNGLVGDIAIPRRSGVGSTYWLSSETTAITFSNSTFDQVAMSPKNLAAIQKHSRQVLLQGTPGIEQLIRDDLRDGLQLAMDLAILNGSGSSGQPTGIMQTSGIGSVAMGTNGGAVTLEKIVDLETAVMEDNGSVNTSGIRYITNPKVMGGLKKLRAGGSSATDGSFLYNTDLSAIGRGGTPAVLNGYGVLTSNQVPSNLTKGSTSGSCSAIVFGDYSQAIVGFWGGGLEITVGEDQDDFSKALTSIRGIMTLDVAVRHPESFAAILDVTT